MIEDFPTPEEPTTTILKVLSGGILDARPVTILPVNGRPISAHIMSCDAAP
jgi:hypothetical protein